MNIWALSPYHPIPNSQMKEQESRAQGTGLPWPDPIISQSKPHPGSVTNSPLKTIRKLIAHSPLLTESFHPFDNLCIFSGQALGLQKQQQQ